MEFTRKGKETIYVHYGHESFDTRLFRPASNGVNLPISGKAVYRIGV